MFCTKCGTKNEDGARFCVNCGAPISGTQPSTVEQNAQQSNVQPNVQPNVQQNVKPNVNIAAPAPKKASFWSFILMFYLGGTIVFNLIFGFASLTGSSYGEYKEMIYGVYGALKFFDVLFGLGLVAIAVLEVVIIFTVEKRKAIAPLLVIIFNIACIAAPVIYLFAAMMITGLPISQLIGWYTALLPISSVVFLIVDVLYLSKHKGDFTN